jgi:hypothetical protein
MDIYAELRTNLDSRLAIQPAGRLAEFRPEIWREGYL